MNYDRRLNIWMVRRRMKEKYWARDIFAAVKL